MSQVPAPDETLPNRLNAGTVLSVAVALLLAMLPGIGVHGGRASATIGAAHSERALVTATARLSEARAELDKAKPDLGSPPILPAAALAFAFFLFGAVALRQPPARAPIPARRPSNARARAPPRA